jgi:hypothetical protein
MAQYIRSVGFAGQASAPTNPTSGNYKTYFKTDGKMYYKDSAGTEVEVGAGGGEVTLTGVQTLTNKTLTSPKINEDVALTATATELNVLDGIPATLTATELGYSDGLTGNIQTQLNGKTDKDTSIVLQTASYTLALTDKATVQKCLSASTITVTIPLNSVFAFPVNSEIVLTRYGAGAVTLAATSGVTLYSSGSKKSINAQYEAVTLKKIATDEWLLIGSLSA